MRTLPTASREHHASPQQDRSSAAQAQEPPAYGIELLDEQAQISSKVQTKLTVGAPDDPYEQEADAMAEYAITNISQKDAPPIQTKCQACEEEERKHKKISPGTPSIQRKCAKCAEEELQMKAQHGHSGTSTADAQFGSQLNTQRGLGSPLPKGLRGEMEGVFSADFGGVRVHTGTAAVQMNQQLGAKAFTHQSDVFFNQGEYNPGSTNGKKLVAHELTHVVQQGAAQQSPAIQAKAAPEVQTDLLDDALAFGGDLVNTGREGIASLVERFSPGLAKMVRLGPFEFLKEKMGGYVENWLDSLKDGIDLQGMAEGLKNWFGNTAQDIRGAITGDQKSCTAFGKMIESVKGFVFKVLEHPILNKLRDGIQKANDVVAGVLTFYIQGELKKIKMIWEGLTDLGNIVSGWINRAKEGLGIVWDKAKEYLGITDDDQQGVMSWISDLANRAWAWIKDTYIPFAMKALKTGGKIWFKLTGLEAIYNIVTAVSDFWKVFSWLWEHRNDPDLVKKAAEDPIVKDTILPAILEKSKNLQETIASAQQTALNWANTLITKILTAIGALTDLPIVSAFNTFLSFIQGIIEKVRNWIQEDLPKIVKAIGDWVSKLYEKIKPVLGVVGWLVIGITVPGALPVVVGGLLAAGLFALIPDCYKGPVIDLLLDIGIRAMKLAPDVPMFGPLWSLFKPGVIEFLVTVRKKSTETKLAIVKRVVEMMVFSSIDFVLGFVWGLMKGILEGILDPFILIYYVGKGLVHLVAWFSRVANQYFGDATPAPPLFGGGSGPPKGKKPPPQPEECKSDEEKKQEGGAVDAGELEALAMPPIMQAEGQAALAQAGGVGANAGQTGAGATSNESVAAQIWGFMESVTEPARTIRNNFTGAVNEYFSQSSNLDFNSLQSKFGEWWGAAQKAISDRSGRLADCMVATLLSPNAQKIASKAAFTVGEVIGWISGTIIIEVVLFLLSSGLVTVTKAILKPLVWLAKLLDKIGDLFMVVFKVLKPLGKLFGKLAPKLMELVGKSAGGALQKVMDAFMEIGKVIARFVDAVPGFKLTTAGREFVEGTGGAVGKVVTRNTAEAVDKTVVKSATEDTSQKTARELGTSSSDPLVREAKDQAAKESRETLAQKRSSGELEEKGSKGAKHADDDGLKIAEFPKAFAEAKTRAKIQDKLQIPGFAITSNLNAIVKPKYRWLKRFDYQPLGGELGQIYLIASSTRLEQTGDEGAETVDGIPVRTPVIQPKEAEWSIQLGDQGPELVPPANYYAKPGETGFVDIPATGKIPDKPKNTRTRQMHLANEANERISTDPDFNEGHLEEVLKYLNHGNPGTRFGPKKLSVPNQIENIKNGYTFDPSHPRRFAPPESIPKAKAAFFDDEVIVTLSRLDEEVVQKIDELVRLRNAALQLEERKLIELKNQFPLDELHINGKTLTFNFGKGNDISKIRTELSKAAALIKDQFKVAHIRELTDDVIDVSKLDGPTKEMVKRFRDLMTEARVAKNQANILGGEIGEGGGNAALEKFLLAREKMLRSSGERPIVEAEFGGFGATNKAGELDLIHEAGVPESTRLVPTEAKFNTADLGFRQVTTDDGLIKAQQGTIEYLNNVVENMIRNGSPDAKKLARNLQRQIQRVLEAEGEAGLQKIEYYLVRTVIDDSSGVVIRFEIQRFKLGTFQPQPSP